MRRNILTFREVTFLYGWIIFYFLLETALVFFIYKFQAILVVLLNQTSKGLHETSVFLGNWVGTRFSVKRYVHSGPRPLTMRAQP